MSFYGQLLIKLAILPVPWFWTWPLARPPGWGSGTWRWRRRGRSGTCRGPAGSRRAACWCCWWWPGGTWWRWSASPASCPDRRSCTRSPPASERSWSDAARARPGENIQNNKFKKTKKGKNIIKRNWVENFSRTLQSCFNSKLFAWAWASNF